MTNHSHDPLPTTVDAATTARHLLDKVSRLAGELTDLQSEVESLVEATEAQAEAAESGLTPAYLTIKQAQEYMGVSRTTLYRLMRNGDLPHYRVGTAVRLVPEDIDGFIRNDKAA